MPGTNSNVPENQRRRPARRGTVSPALVRAGTIEIQPHGNGWYLITIGRPRTTKRFNITFGEAAPLIEAIREHILNGSDQPGTDGGAES